MRSLALASRHRLERNEIAVWTKRSWKEHSMKLA
jgi:hypothetical protein